MSVDSEALTQQDLDEFKQRLLQARQDIIAKAKQAVDSGNIHLDKNEMMDEVDLASATVEQNLTFRLLDRDRKLLAEIDHALKKIENGTYGICEGTGEHIPKRRLELRPWCRHSVRYKESVEKMRVSKHNLSDEEEVS